MKVRAISIDTRPAPGTTPLPLVAAPPRARKGPVAGHWVPLILLIGCLVISVAVHPVILILVVVASALWFGWQFGFKDSRR